MEGGWGVWVGLPKAGRVKFVKRLLWFVDATKIITVDIVAIVRL